MSGPIYPSSRHDRPHARIYHHWTQQPAWIGLTPIAFKIHTFMLASYRAQNANIQPAGGRRWSEICGCDARTAKRAVDELIEKGFLREERKGRNRGNVAGRERIVSLTQYDTETAKGDPNLPVKVWRSKR